MPQEWNPGAPQNTVALSDYDRDSLDKLLYLVRRGYLGSNEVAVPVYAYHDDSMDGTISTTFKFWLPRGTSKVVEMGLRFALLPFRAYSKAGAAGGGVTKTSGASSASTSGSGGSSTPTSGSSSASTTASGGGTTTGNWTDDTGSGSANLGAAGTGASGSAGAVATSSAGAVATAPNYGSTSLSSGTTAVGDHGSHYHSYSAPADHSHTGGAHTHDGGQHTHTGPSHTHTDSGHTHTAGHMHDTSAHTHGMEHTHSVSISSHTHGMAHTHDVTLENHTHTAVYGIYEGTSATGVTVTINGTNRTTALGGGAGFTVDKDYLDINQSGWLTFGNADADCLNTIVLTSTQLGRIRAQVDGLVMRTLKP